MFNSVPSANLLSITCYVVTVYRVKGPKYSPYGWHTQEAVGLHGETALQHMHCLSTSIQLVHGAVLDCVELFGIGVGT